MKIPIINLIGIPIRLLSFPFFLIIVFFTIVVKPRMIEVYKELIRNGVY